MSEMLLLGAGASIEANVPGTYKMTEKIVEKFASDFHLRRRYAHALNFVVGGLLFEQGKLGNNPLTSGVNVEDLFNAVMPNSSQTGTRSKPHRSSAHGTRWWKSSTACRRSARVWSASTN